MDELIKNSLNTNNKVVFNNETTYEESFYKMTLSKVIDSRNSWANGFYIEFNGKIYSFKTFLAFYKKVVQLKKDYNLELKSW